MAFWKTHKRRITVPAAPCNPPPHKSPRITHSQLPPSTTTGVLRKISPRDILETGIYSGHPYSDALFVLQAYWGALFCKLFGFSFTVLRISTLITPPDYCVGGGALSARAAGINRNKSLLLATVFHCQPRHTQSRLHLHDRHTLPSPSPISPLYFFIRAYLVAVSKN